MDKGRQCKIRREFGQRLKELRLNKKMSQEALGLASNLDRTYIGGVERGERNISLVNIYKIAEALNIPSSELFR